MPRLKFLCLLLILLTACDWQVGGSAYHETPYAKKTKQDIIINIGLEPESLDPQLTNGVSEIMVLKTLFEGLVSTSTDGEIEPGLAERWENQDNRIWTFYLRKNARWADGSLITAHDFVYSWRRLADPKTASPVTSALTDVGVLNSAEIVAGRKPVESLGVRAIDDYTFEIILEKPVPFFLATIDFPALYVIPKKTIEKYGNKWTQAKSMLGNGPYSLKTWNINSSIEVVRNPNYWNNAHTKNEKIVFLPITSTISDTINYMSGNEDITASSLPSELFAKLKTHYPNELKISPLACTYFYDLNLKKPPFNDKRVRLALSMTLPRDIVVNKVLGQGQEVTYTHTPYFINHFQRLEPKWAKWGKEKRIIEARKLLNEAGYNQKNPLKFEILYNTLESHKSIAVVVSSEWEKSLGFVQVSLNNMEWKTYLDAIRSGNFSAVRRGSCALYNDPSTFLLTSLSDSSDNNSGYNNPGYDKVIHSVFDAEISTDAIKDKYIQAEKILLEDTPFLMIYSYVQPRLVKQYIKGFEVGPLGDIKLNKLWIDYGHSSHR